MVGSPKSFTDIVVDRNGQMLEMRQSLGIQKPSSLVAPLRVAWSWRKTHRLMKFLLS